MKNKKTSKLGILVILILLLAFGIFKENSDIIDNEPNSEEIRATEVIENELKKDDEAVFKNKLLVHFLDVGQGDCELVCLPSGKVMLIDAGDNGEESIITRYLDKLGIKRIDYLVATHPHADHIGGMEEIIKGYEIGEIYMPRVEAESKTFERMLDAIDEKGLLIHTGETGKVIFSEDSIKARILSPQKGKLYEDKNNNSLVIKLEYQDRSFLFTGDIEEDAERDILSAKEYISADVLKVAHHGSSTSSISEFIDKTQPQYAIISCGEGNEYGHPHKETLDKLESLGIKVLRTDELGTIIITTDGKNLEVEN